MTIKLFDLDNKAERPGHEGVLWRLFNALAMKGIESWIANERLRGTPPDLLAKCLAEVMAGMSLLVAQETSAPNDVLRDIFQLYDVALSDKLSMLKQHQRLSLQ